MIVTSIVPYTHIKDSGTYYSNKYVKFPDDEDYDGIDLIDEEVLGIIENATSRLDIALRIPHEVHSQRTHEWAIALTCLANTL